MKTLADFKRRLTVGLAVSATFPDTVINGNLGQTTFPGKTVVRKVHEVRAGCVIWATEWGEDGSRLSWPRADCLRFIDDNTVEVSDEPGGKPFVTYRFPLV